MRVAVLLVLALLPGVIRAQQFSIEVDSSLVPKAQGAKDYWFAVPQNYEDQSGKYITLSLASMRQVAVHVTCGFSYQEVALLPFKVSTVLIPLKWEMKSSGDVEDLAIHAWTDSIDFVSVLASSGPYGMDGTTLIPASGLGSHFVIGSYSGYYDSNFTSSDFPSEFTVAAAYAPAIIRVLPSCEVRTNGQSHPAGTWFSDRIGVGQAIQYKAAVATNDSSFDLTGTLISSSSPVSVLAASQLARVPFHAPYGNYLLEAMPPVESWGMRYYSAPFRGGIDGDSFLLIGSDSGQIVHRFDRTMGESAVAEFNSRFGFVRVDSVERGSRWRSDKPFVLFQYMNGNRFGVTIPDLTPALVAVPPVSGFRDSLIHITGASVASYDTTYVQVIVAQSAQSSTTYDGAKIVRYSQYPIDSEYSVFLVPHVSDALAFLRSTAPLGLYGYGNGPRSGFAWSALSSPDRSSRDVSDSLAPTATIQAAGTSAMLTFTDNQSGIATSYVENAVNISAALDSTLTVPRKNISYAITSQNMASDGEARIVAFDAAGNELIASVRYLPTNAVRTRTNDVTSSIGVSSVYVEHGQLNIHTARPISGSLDVSVYSVLGERVTIESLRLIQPTQSIRIAVGELPPGAYYIRMRMDGGDTTAKFVVQR